MLLPIASLAVIILGMSIGACGDTASPTASPTLNVTPAAATAGTARASTTPTGSAPYVEGAVGYAISWPQCGALYPEEPFDFGIVGITDGRAFTKNPCFADEYRWAEKGRYPSSIYINLNYRDWVNDFDGAADCGNDPDCHAYRYGRAIVADSYAFAHSVDAIAIVWWLDIQIVSDWSIDQDLNARVIRGAVDFLRAKGIRVGISSTVFQWGEVAGKSSHNLSVWDASALDAAEAAEFCRTGKDLAGGWIEQIAYVEEYETVVACGPRTPAAQ